MTIIRTKITAFAKDLKLIQKSDTLSSICYYRHYVRLENYNTKKLHYALQARKHEISLLCRRASPKTNSSP